VVGVTCDRNGETVLIEVKKSGKHFTDGFVIPEGWLHVSANTSESLVFESDLCPECAKPVLAAAGYADKAGA
jgi:hypothetical protein